MFNATWILVAVLYALAVWLARRGRWRAAGVCDLPWRVAALFYTVSLYHRGKGHCTEMLRWAHKKFGPLKVEIRADNAASIKAKN